MSIVIVGGNECMECQYKEICKRHGCKAKVFTKERGNVGKKIGCPDLLVMFTNTVSHKMMNTAVAEAKRKNVEVAWVHSSSSSALKNLLAQYV